MVRISSFNLIWHIEVNGKFVLPFPINETLTFPINDKLIKYNYLQLKKGDSPHIYEGHHAS
jgi:hypothetical protein